MVPRTLSESRQTVGHWSFPPNLTPSHKYGIGLQSASRKTPYGFVSACPSFSQRAPSSFGPSRCGPGPKQNSHQEDGAVRDTPSTRGFGKSRHPARNGPLPGRPPHDSCSSSSIESRAMSIGSMVSGVVSSASVAFDLYVSEMPGKSGVADASLSSAPFSRISVWRCRIQSPQSGKISNWTPRAPPVLKDILKSTAPAGTCTSVGVPSTPTTFETAMAPVVGSSQVSLVYPSVSAASL